MSLEGKTAIVTGGARGIGRAICIALAKAGANVVTCYARSAEACEETIRMVEECGVKGMCVKADVSNLEEITAMVDTVKKEFGTIDILVNNAGITKDNLIMGISEEDFDAVIDTNLKGAFLFTKALSRTMLKQKGGRIINNGSISATTPRPSRTPSTCRGATASRRGPGPSSSRPAPTCPTRRPPTSSPATARA